MPYAKLSIILTSPVGGIWDSLAKLNPSEAATAWEGWREATTAHIYPYDLQLRLRSDCALSLARPPPIIRITADAYKFILWANCLLIVIFCYIGE